MKLYLVQHGDSTPKEVDPLRPLSKQGEMDVQNLADFLADAGVTISEIMHSGKLRAAQTAEILRLQLFPEGTLQERDGLKPMDSVHDLSEMVNDWREDTMVVGHLPFMARLSSLLLCGDTESKAVAFTPGSVLCLERGEDRLWSVRWMLRPELIRS